MARTFDRVFAALALLALGACAHTTNENQALCGGDGASACTYDPASGYRFRPGKDADRSTLIVVTFSGGGIRASALAYGTLMALGELPSPSGDGRRLLDNVDIVSSVSGGSVTAGWYALKGKEGLAPAGGDNPLVSFLYNGGQGAIAWRALNPVSLVRYGLTDYQRSDALAEFFADRLFGKATYAEVEQRYRERADQPFVILNATDLGHQTRFPFTQGRFDLICSDLGGYSLAYAVTASANFPIVFSPIGINNYSADCNRIHASAAWQEAGPPRWLARYDRYEASDSAGTTATLSPLTNGLLELRAAREARGYTNPGPQDKVLHLVDGGLVDNLGVLSTLAIEDDPGCAPGIFQRLAAKNAARPQDCDMQSAPARVPALSQRYAKIKKVLYIVVNARTRSPASIDDTVYPPGIVSSTLRVVGTPIDSTSLDTQNYLTAEMEAILGPTARECPGATRRTDAAAASGQRCFKIVAVDFEMIPFKACRDAFWQLGTSWQLDRPVIEKVMELPRVLLAKSRDLVDIYNDVPSAKTEFKDWAASKNFSAVCNDAPPPTQ